MDHVVSKDEDSGRKGPSCITLNVRHLVIWSKSRIANLW